MLSSEHFAKTLCNIILNRCQDGDLENELF